jgi:hypothetical protein
VLQGRGVQHNVDPFHAPLQVLPVANVAQVQIDVIVLAALLLQKKELALVVVDPNDLRGVALKELVEDAGSHRPANAGNQYAFVLPELRGHITYRLK